ncbi:MAG: response regulator transcription factor [Chitinophagaceae bacterium]|nr:response regulator transcription factor [Chitinophagaceae bacterium]MCW5914874.1 response regulator transcription factor [Chitinophagaceae bacterium]MCZ2396216.1 response regulator transcription factor [Chitinophagales bacterium]
MSQENEEVVKVMIVDDHALFRAGVRTTLSIKKDIKVIGEAENGLQLMNMLKAGTIPDVILLDIQMPIMDGTATLPEVKKLYPDIKVIMLTLVEDQTFVTKLMELGANSYLVKTSDAEIIYDAIKTCYKQEFYFNTLTNQALLNNLRQKNTPGSIKMPQEDAVLTEKEITILRLMCEEKSTREIAEIIGQSPRTIEATRDKLKAKTGTKSTAGLILFAVKHKLLDEDV